MKQSPIYVVLGWVLCAVILSGCSREPSQAEIRTAFDVEIKRANAASPATGILGKAELHDVKKLGCKRALEGNGYNCDVEVDMTVPFVGRQKQAGPIRLVKGAEGWVVMQK